MTKRNVKDDLKFVDLTRENFPKYVDFLLASEDEFNPDLREGLEGLTRALSSEGFVGTIAHLDKKYIGNAMGLQ